MRAIRTALFLVLAQTAGLYASDWYEGPAYQPGGCYETRCIVEGQCCCAGLTPTKVEPGQTIPSLPPRTPLPGAPRDDSGLDPNLYPHIYPGTPTYAGEYMPDDENGFEEDFYEMTDLPLCDSEEFFE